MRILTTFALYACFSIVAACSARIPEPATYPYSQQKKMQAAEHWRILAADVAARINEQLVLAGHADKQVYVEYNCGSDEIACKENETSPFNEAFRDLLITSLYDLRIPTKTIPDNNAFEIDFKVQIVRHNANRIQTVQPGVITALTAAIAVLRDAPTSLLLMGTGAGVDIANSNLAISGHDEIIITTTMTYQGSYFFRSSDIYYINDPDFWQYIEETPEGATVRFSSNSTQKQQIKEQSLIPHVLPVPAPPNTHKERKTNETQMETI